MTTIASQTQVVRNQNTAKPETDVFLAQLQLEPRPTAAPPAAPASAPANGGSVRIGGSGLNFPMSTFDPEAGSLVALLDAGFQELDRQGQPMVIGGMSVQEYGQIRHRLGNLSDSGEGIAQYQDDMARLYEAINIAGGEGMPIPDNIKELLEKWRKEQQNFSMTQQPRDNSNPLDSNNNPPPFATPNPRGPQTQGGGLPQSAGSQVGFDTGGASGASGAQGTSGGESATERQLRDLLDDIGAPNDPNKSVYEALTQVLRDVVTNNPYSSPDQLLKLAEIARILATADTGYRNSDLQELTRITASPESRRAHALGNQLATLAPGEATSVTVDGEKVANVRRNADGSYFIQALKPMVVRPPGGRATPLEAYAAHNVPQGTKFTVPGFGEPIRLGIPPLEPPLVRYPTPALEPTEINRRSYNADAYRDPAETRPDAATGSPSPGSTTSLPPLPTPTELDSDTFKLPEQVPQARVPDIGATNRRYNDAMTQIGRKLTPTSTEQYPAPGPEQIAGDVAGVINRELPPAERALAGHMAAREAKKVLSAEAFSQFMNAFDAHLERWQGDSSGGKSDDKSDYNSMGGSKPDLTSLIGNERLLERLGRIVEVGEKAGFDQKKLAALSRVMEMLAPR
jgi:hypothetical protein